MSENSETKWTAGPWTLNQENGLCLFVRGSSDYPIAEVLRQNFDATLFANGKLIAAAPELLEALEGVIALSDRKHDAWDKARAAIAKARGTR